MKQEIEGVIKISFDVRVEEGVVYNLFFEKDMLYFVARPNISICKIALGILRVMNLPYSMMKVVSNWDSLSKGTEWYLSISI